DMYGGAESDAGSSFNVVDMYGGAESDAGSSFNVVDMYGGAESDEGATSSIVDMYGGAESDAEDGARSAGDAGGPAVTLTKPTGPMETRRARPLTTDQYEVIDERGDGVLFRRPGEPVLARRSPGAWEGASAAPEFTMLAQEYVETSVSDRPRLRISADSTLAVEDGVAGQRVFATEAAVAESNAKLRRAGHIVALKVDRKKAIVLPAEDGESRRLFLVEPEFKPLPGQSQDDGSRQFTEYLNATGRVSHLVFGGRERGPVTTAPVNAADPTEIIGTHYLAEALTRMADGKIPPQNVTPGWAAEQIRQDARPSGGGGGPLPGEGYGSALALSDTPSPRRGALSYAARLLGINEHAWADVGESYAVQSVAAPGDGGGPDLTRNFAKPGSDPAKHVGYHFATVVLQSEDGKTQITLENHARKASPAWEAVRRETVEANLSNYTLDELKQITEALKERRAQHGGDSTDPVRKELNGYFYAAGALVRAKEAQERVLSTAEGSAERAAAEAALDKQIRGVISGLENLEEVLGQLIPVKRQWYMRMLSKRPGESMHDVSAGLLEPGPASVANPLTSVVLLGHYLSPAPVRFMAGAEVDKNHLISFVRVVAKVGLWNHDHRIDLPSVTITGPATARGRWSEQTEAAETAFLELLDGELQERQADSEGPHLTAGHFMITKTAGDTVTVSFDDHRGGPRRVDTRGAQREDRAEPGPQTRRRRWLDRLVRRPGTQRSPLPDARLRNGRAVARGSGNEPRWHGVVSPEGRHVGDVYFPAADAELRSFYGGFQGAGFRFWRGAPGREVSVRLELPVSDRSSAYLLAWHGSQPPRDEVGVVRATAREIVGQGFTTLFLVRCTDATPEASPELARVARDHGLAIFNWRGGAALTPEEFHSLPDEAGRPGFVEAYREDGGVDYYGPAGEVAGAVPTFLREWQPAEDPEGGSGAPDAPDAWLSSPAAGPSSRPGRLPGGSPDQGRNPLEEGWPVGRRLTVMEPRSGDLADLDLVPLHEVPDIGETSGEPFVWERSHPSHSAPFTYEIERTGVIRLLGGLSPDDWTSFGHDFVHEPTGAYLRGDNGWIGHIGNHGALLGQLYSMDPAARPHRLVVDETAMYLVPLEESGMAVRIPLRDGTGGASGSDATPLVPWYVANGGLGDGSVSSVDDVVDGSLPGGRPDEAVSRWIDAVTSGMASSVARAVRKEILAVLAEKEPARWERLLLHGELIVEENTRVKLSFSVEEAKFASPEEAGTDPGYQTYFSKYGDTTYAEQDSRERRSAKHGQIEPILFLPVAVQVALSHFSPVFKAGTERGYGSWQTILMEVQSGNRVITNATHGHTARIRVRATVDRAEGPDLLLPGKARLAFPKVYTSAAEAAVLMARPKNGRHPVVPVVDPDVLHGIDHAVTAIVPEPLLAGLRSVLDHLGLPAKGVDEIVQEVAEEYANEKTFKDRSQWWLTDSWVTSLVAKKMATLSEFQGHLEFSGRPHTVRYVTTTDEEVLLRNDIADTVRIADGQKYSTGASTTPGVAFGIELGRHMATPSVDLPKLSSSHEYGRTLTTGGQLKNAIMRKDRLVRYQTEFLMTVRVRSGHGDVSFTLLVTGELGIGLAHAKEFERNALGGALTGSGLIPAEQPKAPGAAEELDTPAGSTALEERSPAAIGESAPVQGETTGEDAAARPEVAAGPEPQEPTTAAGEASTAPEPGTGRSAPSWADFAQWLRSRFTDGRPPEPFPDGGVRDTGDLVALAGRGPIEIVLPPALHDAYVPHWLDAQGGWQALYAHPGVTWVLPAEEHAFLVSREDSGGPGPVWRYVLNEDARVVGALLMDDLEGERQPRWYVPNPAADRPMTAEAPRPWYEDLLPPLHAAGLTAVIDFLNSGGTPQVQLTEALQGRLRDPGEDRTLHEAVDALLAEPRIQVLAPDGRRVPEQEGGEQAGERRFVLDERGQAHGPLRTWHHVVHPREPLALAARTGLGRGIVREMPGREKVYREIVDELARQMRTAGVEGRMSAAARQHLARALAMKFGVPGGRGTAADGVDGDISHEVTIDGYTFTAVLHTELRALRRDPVAEVNVSLDTQRKNVAGVDTEDKKGRAVGAGFKISFRVRIKGLFSLDVHLLELHGERAWHHKIGVATGVKEYRRARTNGDATRFEYETVYRPAVTTRRASGEPVAARVWERSGDEYWTAVTVSDEHLPAKPLPADEILTYGQVTVKTGPMDEEGFRRLAAPPGKDRGEEFHLKSLTGVHVDLTGANEISANIAELVGAHNKVRGVRPQDDAFKQVLAALVPSGRRYGAAEQILRTGTRTFLESNARRLLTHTAAGLAGSSVLPSPTTRRGLRIPLPSLPHGWRQEVRVWGRTFNVRHEQTVKGTTLEQYSESDLRFGEENATSYGVDTSAGPAGVFQHRPSGEGDDAGHEPTSDDAGHEPTSNKAASGASIGLVGGGEASRGRSEKEMGGALDLNLGTYSGDGEQLGADVVYTIEYRRWRDVRGKRKLLDAFRRGEGENVRGARKLLNAFRRGAGERVSYRAQRHVKITRGVELLVPYVLAADHGLPVPARDDLPSAKGERHYLHDDLAMAAAHIEEVDAADVVDTIEALLGGNVDPDVLTAIETAYDEEAIRSQYKTARRGGIPRIFTTPAPMWGEGHRVWDYLKMDARTGGTLHIGTRVIAIEDSITYRRPRPDVKLTTGGQAFVQIGKDRSRGHGWHVEGFGDGRWATAPFGLRPAGGASATYERRDAVKTGLESTARDVRRATAKDTAQEFSHSLRYRVEVFFRYSPSELFQRSGQVAKLLPQLVDVLSRGEAHRMWRHLFPAGTPAAASRDVHGRAKVLVPTHLTAAGPRPDAAGTPVEISPALTRTRPPAPTALATSLAEHVHAMTLPGIEHLARWAPAAAMPRRRIDEAAVARGVAPTTKGFGPAHENTLTVDIALDERDAAANIDKLLRGTYRIPLVGGDDLTLQMVPTRGRWKTRGGFTGLNFPEHSQEPAREHEAERGWTFAGETNVGHAFARPIQEGADQPIIDPGGSYSKAKRKARMYKNSAGDYVESNRQRDDDYDYYVFDARFYVSGPRGHHVVLDVPDGFIGMLPVTVARRLINDLGPDLERPPLGDAELPASWAESGTLPPEATAEIIDLAGGMAALRGRTLRLWTRTDHLATAAATAKRITTQTGIPVELLTRDTDGTISRYPQSAPQAPRPVTTSPDEPGAAVKPSLNGLTGPADEGPPASAPLIDEDRQVSLADLERAGIDLTPAQRSQAILSGGLRGADLTRVQRSRPAVEIEPVVPEPPVVSSVSGGRRSVVWGSRGEPRWRRVVSPNGDRVGDVFFDDADWASRAPFYWALRHAGFVSWRGVPGREVAVRVEVPVDDRSGVYLLAWHGSQPPDEVGVVRATAREIVSRGFTTLFLLRCTHPGVAPSAELSRVARDFKLTIFEWLGVQAPTPWWIHSLPDKEGRPTSVRAYRADGGVDHYGAAEDSAGVALGGVADRLGYPARELWNAPSPQATSSVPSLAAVPSLATSGSFVRVGRRGVVFGEVEFFLAPMVGARGDGFGEALVASLGAAGVVGAPRTVGELYARVSGLATEEDMPVPPTVEGRELAPRLLREFRGLLRGDGGG
ncbi:hypothetical protein NE235_36850, partial [Actinoallomurus spadix]|uniref:hypothetical protein n=1 Tax=Actinoallomurus spadix TaxID=79912 RepID=UPI0020936F06